MLRSLGCLSKTSTGHHGLKFLEGLFRNEKLSTSHKTKTENSLELSFAIFVFQRCIFSLKIQNVGLENHLIVSARQPFCWKWIPLLKTFKNMLRVMLRSLSTQILWAIFLKPFAKSSLGEEERNSCSQKITALMFSRQNLVHALGYLIRKINLFLRCFNCANKKSSKKKYLLQVRENFSPDWHEWMPGKLMLSTSLHLNLHGHVHSLDYFSNSPS